MNEIVLIISDLAYILVSKVDVGLLHILISQEPLKCIKIIICNGVHESSKAVIDVIVNVVESLVCLSNEGWKIAILQRLLVLLQNCHQLGQICLVFMLLVFWIGGIEPGSKSCVLNHKLLTTGRTLLDIVWIAEQQICSDDLVLVLDHGSVANVPAVVLEALELLVVLPAVVGLEQILPLANLLRLLWLHQLEVLELLCFVKRVHYSLVPHSEQLHLRAIQNLGQLLVGGLVGLALVLHLLVQLVENVHVRSLDRHTRRLVSPEHRVHVLAFRALVEPVQKLGKLNI